MRHLNASMRRNAFASVLAGAALLLLAVPSGAAAKTADMGVTGELLSAEGAERVVQFTLTNHGPDGWDVTNNIGLDFIPQGPVEIVSVEPCGPTNNQSGGAGQRNCGYGKSLPAGESVEVEVRLRVGGSGARIFGRFYSSDGGEGFEPNDPRFEQDPNPANGTAVVELDDVARCVVKAKNPQRAASTGFKVKVLASAEGGCTAALTGAKLTIGRKKYTFLGNRPQRTLAAGETWKLALSYASGTLSAIRKALANGKKVSASAQFDIDGTRRTGKARLK